MRAVVPRATVIRVNPATNVKPCMTETVAPICIDLQATLRDADIQPILEQLDPQYLGLEPVKMRIREIAALLLVEKARHQLGLNSTAPSLHMSFSGNPGTGKTTIARRMAEILHLLTVYRETNGRGSHPRRFGRSIYRPHRAQNQGSFETRNGRRAVHRRSLLSLQARE